MADCTMCGASMPEERLDFGYDYCIDCARANPVLARPQFGVLGVHKSTPIVVSIDSPEWRAHQTFMRR